MEWSDEIQLISAEALLYGVDPRWIATIRKVENGAPGKEFGVLSVHAPDYASQLKECCISVAHRLYLYEQSKKAALQYSASGLRYSEAFIQWFAGIWAPNNAGNDPTGLNSNWYKNALYIYGQMCGPNNLHAVG